jgi:hypothetical protein
MMRRMTMVAAVAALMAAGACGRTSDGDVTLERPGDVDVRTTTDTLNAPRVPSFDIDTRPETVIFNRPTINRDSARRDSVRRDSIRRRP